MLKFNCGHCEQQVFFDNSLCLRCQSPLGYVYQRGLLISLTESAPGRFVEVGDTVETWQRCATAEVTGCNWLVPYGSEALCSSCALTRTRPAVTDLEGMAEFVRAESAKRRLLFQLHELGLPVTGRNEDRETGLAFDLLSSVATKVITGHDDGVITLDLAEADDEHREHLRRQLNEPYRTLLGHFRHEIGHYYWSLLVDDPTILEACRAIFGDDTQDYQEAVRRHYGHDAAPDAWSGMFISHYATMHPYEDWAETFAHYLHILDTLQTAESFGLQSVAIVRHQRERDTSDPTRPDGSGNFGVMIDHWLEMSSVLNQINRSMGRDDLYPFVLPPAVIRKLAFVDKLVQRQARRASQDLTGPEKIKPL